MVADEDSELVGVAEATSVERGLESLSGVPEYEKLSFQYTTLRHSSTRADSPRVRDIRRSRAGRSDVEKQSTGGAGDIRGRLICV